jgi:hypothetical protein
VHGEEDLDRPPAGTPVELEVVLAAWPLPAVVVAWDDAGDDVGDDAGVLRPEPLPEDDRLVFLPDDGAAAEPLPAAPGDPWPDAPSPSTPAELFWLVDGRLRVAPAQVTAVARVGGVPHWSVRLLGPAADGQRRQAVRAPVTWPVALTTDGGRLVGETLDVSESGLRARLTGEEGAGRPHRRQPVGVALRTDGGELLARAQVRRVQEAAAPWQWTVSVRFTGLSQASAEVVRREVRAGLVGLEVRGDPGLGHPGP